MRKKGIAALALSCCLAAGILGGCGQREEKETDRAEGIGKYVEEDVSLPLQPGEEPMYLLKRADGQLEVYAGKADGICSRYLSADGKEWQAQEASWLADYTDAVLDLVAGADGNDYAVVMDQKGETLLIKETEAGKAEEMRLPALETVQEAGPEDFQLFGIGLLVMEDGKLVLIGEEAKVCDPASGEVLHTFPYERTEISGGCVADVRGGRLALVGEEGNGFTIWDVEKEREEATVSYGAKVQDGKVVLEEKGDLYFLNKDGLHHMNPQGTLVETLAEGSAMTMGDPQIYIEGFVKGQADDFYGLYVGMGENAMIKHYYFDEKASVGAEQRLTIYSLKENDTVRQAISLFRQSHPEVEVSYKTGASDTAASRTDQLRVLNTELLNGNGADVLLLDELPVKSLIEKGVLADISGILNPMLEEGAIQKNIGECYRQADGKIYCMPVRYGIPLLYGKQELEKAMDSLKQLEAWLASHPEKLMAGPSYEELTQLFLALYEEELMGVDGQLSPEALSRCLSCIKKIGERYNADLENEYLEDFGAYGGVIAGSYPVDGSGEELVSYAEIKGMFDTMIPFQTMREKGYPMVYGKDSFLPHGVAGINSAAKEPELAEEFLKTLFSQELQSYDLQDGLPVNPKAAEALIAQGRDSLEDSDAMGGAVVSVVGDAEEGDVGSDVTFSFSAPLKAELEEMFAKTEELKKAVSIDGVLLDMIMEEAKAYYEGSRELEEAVQEICRKADTYRAE